MLSWVRIPRPSAICVERNASAALCEISPAAIGRVFVRSEWRVSHPSLLACILSSSLARSLAALTNSSIHPRIPHIINNTPGTTHNNRADTKQAEIPQPRRDGRRGGRTRHRDTPRARPVQQDRAGGLVEAQEAEVRFRPVEPGRQAVDERGRGRGGRGGVGDRRSRDGCGGSGGAGGNSARG